MVSSIVLLSVTALVCALALLAAWSVAKKLRRVRAELAAERRRADLLVRATQSGIIDWDAASRTAWHSARYKEMLGYAPDTDTSAWPDAFEMIHPEDKPRVYREFVAHLKQVAVNAEALYQPVDYRLKRADGSWIWVQGVGLSVGGSDGRATRFLAVIRDISQRRAQDEALREQIELTRDLIRSVPNPLFHKDENLRFVNVNPAWEKMSGISAEKAIGGLVHEVYPPQFAAAFEEQDRELLAAPDGMNTMEITIPGRKRTRHYILSKALLRRDDGSLRGMVGSCTEITDLKRIDAELRDQVALTRALIDSNPNAIYLKGTDCRYVVVNDAWLAMTGTTRERAIGHNVLELFPEKESERYDAEDRRLLAQGRGSSEVESMRTGPDGKPQWVIIRKSVLRRSDGTVAGLVGTNTDITPLKRIEEDLRRSREEAMQAAQAKAAFLAAMSHEIRTPLNGVLGMAGLLADTRLSAEQREYVDTIRVSGDALLSVINDILDFSKIESGRMALEQEPFEPVRAVEESLEILGEQARGKRIELIAEVDDAVPPWVRGDLARLRQVLVNLVGNAVKFTERGEVVVRLRAGPAGSLAFAVSDTGIGIPPEGLEALFQPFTQADVSTTRKYGGTGLGLAISRRLVELMGGTLRADSTPGAGSTFSFEVAARECDAPPRLAPVAQTVSLAGRRILIVDDNATNLRILRRQLERWGAVPVAVAAPAAALELVERDQALDAALLDYHMPGMDGVMLARRIKAVAKSLPLVLLSSSMYRRAEEAEAGLFVQQLLKPVRQQHLREALAAALAGPGRKPAKPRRARAKPAAATGGLRVLVVDDVEVNRRLAQALLRKLGHTCDAAASGLEGVEMAAAGKHDVVLMDVQMPDIDGMEAMRRIRERLGAAAPRVVAMTANAMPGDRERCLAAGMDGYLAKPIDPRALAEEVAGANPAEPVLDRARLKALLEFDADGAMLNDIFDAFLRDAAKYVESAGQAQARADLAEVARSAHALKGAASNAGAKALAQIAGRIEALAREGAADGLELLLKTLASTYEQTAAALAGLRRR